MAVWTLFQLVPADVRGQTGCTVARPSKQCIHSGAPACVHSPKQVDGDDRAVLRPEGVKSQCIIAVQETRHHTACHDY